MTKRYVPDESLSWEKRHGRLEEHHREETEELVALLAKALVGLEIGFSVLCPGVVFPIIEDIRRVLGRYR